LIDKDHSLNWAASYSEIAEVDKARALLEDLLKSSSVQSSPEHLARVYTIMAKDTVARSRDDQATSLKEALRHYPRTSTKLPFSYLSLAMFHLKTGDDAAAEQAIREAMALPKTRGKLRRKVREVVASLHSFRGDFKLVKRTLWPIRFEASAIVSANNLAVCMEYLGDIAGAIGIQEYVLRRALSLESQLFEILSLANLAAMETKLGKMSSAQSRFATAVRKLEASSALDTPLISIYVDVALYSLQLGLYRAAFECLEKVERRGAGPFQIEAINFQLARCELYLEIGQTETARRILGEIENAGPYRNKFIEIERVLMAVRCKLQPDLLMQLEEAVAASSRLGTLHQHCRALLEFSRASSSASEVGKAVQAARRAKHLANKYGYRPLVARSSLLLASVENDSALREANLTEALQEASRMGLRPLVVNCLHALGAYYSEKGDYWRSLQCLREGVNLLHRSASSLRPSDRKTYLARPESRGMKDLLENVEQRISPYSYISQAPSDNASFLTGLYRIASTLRAALSPEAKRSILVECLCDAIPHPVFIVSHDRQGKPSLLGTRNLPTDSLRKRIMSMADSSVQRPTFSRINEATKGVNSLWIPFGRLWPGGVYTEWSSDHSMDERQFDFLNIATTLVGPALDSLDATDKPIPIQQMEGIVGASTRMQAVYGLIDSAASSNATVLIEGESGTGKELIAQAIHRRSARGAGPFVPIDCGGLPESLMDAELFGATKGSYTGAIGDRMGLFESANGGTLFLDEIGNASATLQTRLLRVLQEREVRRVGGTSVRPLDIRLVAATNSDLRSLVSQGQFRRDLLYRLLVLHIAVPPLRDRLEDVPMLAMTFLDRLNRQYSQRKRFSREVFHGLVTHTYPGNIRELQNTIERAYFTAQGQVIRELHLDLESAGPGPRNNIQVLFRDLTHGRVDFWRSVHDSYRRRDVPRETVVGVLDLGLRATQGSYKGVATLFRIEGKDYRKFMDFLRRNRCLLDFRPYRELVRHATFSHEAL
jgi:DNA-binding NtrC family response regulator/tetratricopeptide (TPR) repeat protein